MTETPTEIEPAATLGRPDGIAGFWRRLFAALLDFALLGVVGLILGFSAFEFFMSMGSWGRLIGFAIALAYLGGMNSQLAGGQTLGKRLLKIRVTGANGEGLPLARSMARFAVLGIPYFLNGLPLYSPEGIGYWLGVIVFILITGLGGAVIYLYVFNRSTRQSVHDFAVGSFVISTSAQPTTSPGPVWAGHAVVLTVILAISAATPLLIDRGVTGLLGESSLTSLFAARDPLMKLPEVRQVGLIDNTLTFTSSDGESRTTRSTIAKIFLARELENLDAFAVKTAFILATHYPAALEKDRIDIILTLQFDLGIAHGNTSTNYRLPIVEWRKMWRTAGFTAP